MASSRESVTTTPLPAASPSSLTTCGAPSASRAASTSSIVVQTWASAVGTSAAAMTSLAKDLLPSRRAASAEGPKTAKPGRTAYVGNACDERGLGPDDDEVDLVLPRQGGDRVAVEDVDGDAQRRRVDAGVAGRRDHRVDLRVGRDGLDECVFAGA